jgi:VIT1/CCC1 family predicted Fe2+/Mn2+ transporter
VLGANDGIVSTASLILGVAATGAGTRAIVVAGVASLVAGAMSMAAGEYVSVSSQADTENADLARERTELAEDPKQEHAELTSIYRKRGLSEDLASSVATQLMAHDALGAHARDELGVSETLAARPVQAALASAATFAAGALLPLLVGAVACSDEVFFPHVARLMGLRGNPDPVDAPEWKAARPGIEASYRQQEALLRDRDSLAGEFTYTDITFYMTQFFAARQTVPMTVEHERLLAWRERVIDRTPVRRVVSAMTDYLRSQGRPVPELGGRPDA